MRFRKNITTLPALFIAFTLLFFYSTEATAQTLEPELKRTTRVAIPLTENYRSAYGFNFLMNNFGFGTGFEFRRAVAPQTELLGTIRFTGLRDASEQTFTDFFFGQQIVPNKYQRALAFPLMIGARQRLFARLVQEDYRFFLSFSAGPTLAFSYPYFQDMNNNGFRETFVDYFEPVNDMFSGISDGSWHWGGAGEIKLSLDIGSNFARLSTVEFGYFFYYFPDAIQIMMPFQPALNPNRRPGESGFIFDENRDLVLEPFFEPQSFFGTPQITFTFGWMR